MGFIKTSALTILTAVIIGMLFLKPARGQGIVSEENMWNVLGYDAWFTATETYIIDGDSVINNNVYKLMWMTFDSVDVNWMYQGLLREDSNIVYYVPPGEEEGILYDFNMDIGDTAYIINMFCTHDSVQVIVENIDTAEYFGIDRRQWHLNGSIRSEEMWIEGIGSNMGILHSMYYHCIVCPAWDLMCFQQGDQLLYSLYSSYDCYVVDIDENEFEEIIEIFPNPASDKFEVRSSVFGIEMIRIFDMQGRLVMEKNCYGSNQLSVDCHKLEPGLYLYQILSGNQLFTNKLIIQ